MFADSGIPAERAGAASRDAESVHVSAVCCAPTIVLPLNRDVWQGILALTVMRTLDFLGPQHGYGIRGASNDERRAPRGKPRHVVPGPREA
jgi:hypothetical protein